MNIDDIKFTKHFNINDHVPVKQDMCKVYLIGSDSNIITADLKNTIIIMISEIKDNING